MSLSPEQKEVLAIVKKITKLDQGRTYTAGIAREFDESDTRHNRTRRILMELQNKWGLVESQKSGPARSDKRFWRAL